MNVHQHSDGHYELIGERGGEEVFFPAPGLVLVKGWGHGSSELADRTLQIYDAARRDSGKLFIFNDAYRMRSYEIDIARTLNQWLKLNRPYLGRFAVLHQNPLVAMAVKLTNILADDLVWATTRRAEFEALLAETAREHSGA
jgi:hypothetical protein